MIRHPPTPTLFPYTTLFRSLRRSRSRFRSTSRCRRRTRRSHRRSSTAFLRPCTRRHRTPRSPKRSEEHTSELQSQSNLVCRLLLEKKKILTLLDIGTYKSTL